MSLTNFQIEDFLTEHEVDFRAAPADESEQFKKQWLLTYVPRVKKETGEWIHNRFRWHAFSYGYQSATTGTEALIAYQRQWQASYVIFDEEDSWTYFCSSKKYPDFSSLRADIYVAHHNMKWTMVFTHEQPDIGPYLALKPKNLE